MNWLYVIIMSRKNFRVNPHSIVCLNVKELLAWSRHHIWILSHNNEANIQADYRARIHPETRLWHDNNIQSNAPYKQVLTTQINHLASLAKRLSVGLQIKWLWVWISLLSLKLQIWCLLRTRSSLTFRHTIECRFTLKLVCDMIITYSQIHRADKCSQHSSIIWSVWLNRWVNIYKLSGCGFKSRCCQLDMNIIHTSNRIEIHVL